MHEAKTHLSQLLREVEAGPEVVIPRGGRPVVRIVPVATADARLLGGDRDVLVVPADLDAPSPASVVDAFEP